MRKITYALIYFISIISSCMIEAVDSRVVRIGSNAGEGGMCSSGTLATYDAGLTNMNCTICPPGSDSYQVLGQIGNPTACTPCKAGYFKPELSDSDKQKVVRGDNYDRNQYIVIGDNPHMASSPHPKLMCQPCPAGQYQDQTGQATCKPCPAGQYQDLPGQTSCKPCNKGSYSAAGAKACTLCPIGSYASSDGATKCTLCSIGYTTFAKGSTLSNDCKKCPSSGCSG